jgi:hypothetical protein
VSLLASIGAVQVRSTVEVTSGRPRTRPEAVVADVVPPPARRRLVVEAGVAADATRPDPDRAEDVPVRRVAAGHVGGEL